MLILLDDQNRQVRLTPERLAHILTHPEMIDMDSLIVKQSIFRLLTFN